MPSFRPFVLASLAVACGPDDPNTSDATGDTNGVVDSDSDTIPDSDVDTDAVPTLECDVVATGGRWGGTIDLPSGCTLSGERTGDFAGARLDVGDFDGDGRADVVTSAPNNGPEIWPGSPSGRVYIVQGSVLADRILSRASYATRPGGHPPQYGRSVVFTRDMDGDGADEVVVGADVIPEAVEVLRHAANDDHFDVVRWQGDTSALYGHGWDVADAGDVDGDGLHDFIAGAPTPIDIEGTPGPLGQAYLVFGPPPEGEAYYFPDSANIRISGSVAEVGTQVAGLGDLNGDGNDDFAVCDTWNIWSVFHGPGSSILADSDADATLSGFGVAVGGFDIDSDGVNDMVVGDASSGRVLAFRGADVSGTVGDSSAVLRIDGESPGDGFGGEVAVVDLDGDDMMDLLASAAAADVRGADGGTVYLFYGDVAGMSSATDADGRFEGGGSFAAGTSIAVGDVTGDTVQDILIGDPGGDGEEPGAGFVSVLPGAL